jgi:hypothetical protein
MKFAGGVALISTENQRHPSTSAVVLTGARLRRVTAVHDVAMTTNHGPLGEADAVKRGPMDMACRNQPRSLVTAHDPLDEVARWGCAVLMCGD